MSTEKTTPAERPIISFRSVTKSFGPLTVLHNFDLEVVHNEKLALIGPSGSGKSTILRILMTLEDIQCGSVEIEGEALWCGLNGRSERARESDLRRLRLKVGMVFQQFNLFPHMTAVRNVAEAPIRVLGLSKEKAYERAHDLLALVGLEDKAGSFPIQLSGGQQQRVAIARALAMRPKILLLDEITSALDPETVGEVLSVVRRLAREFRFTILLVTHQMGFARTFADRVCFLENGRIIEEGTPTQIFEATRNERTRAFLAAMLDV
jgi:polar amino acid transport system ATP-binding protein